MTAREFLFNKYPLVSPEWFDDNKLTQEMIRMMEGYAEKVIEERIPTKKRNKEIASEIFYDDFPYERKLKVSAFMLCDEMWRKRMKGGKR